MKSVRRRDKTSNPGRYRHYAPVKAITKTKVGLSYTEVPTTALNAYFSVNSLSGREKLIAEQLRQKISHVLRTPYRSTWQADFDNARYIVIQLRNFYIRSAFNVDEMNREIEIYCEEKV